MRPQDVADVEARKKSWSTGRMGGESRTSFWKALSVGAIKKND
jgi:hypothetical protein